MINKFQLVWIDQNVNNSENKCYQQQLKQLINDCYFIEQKEDALKFLHNLKGGEKIIVIVSSSFVYKMIDPLGYAQIYFCGNSQLHIKKFLENKELLILIDSGINQLQKIVQINKEFLLAKEQLNMSFDKQITKNLQYYHQFEEISFRFLLINQKLKQKVKLSEQSLESEIKYLTSQQELDRIKREVQNKQNQTKQDFTLFEKLIYYYTTENVGNKINENLAQSNYENLQQIMLTLFNGYSQFKQKELPQRLYRGISYENEKKSIYDQILLDLEQSQSQQKSLYWNTLSSTSYDFQEAKTFAKSKKFGILFEIILQNSNPHPFFKLEPYHSKFSYEQEVLLFPQFQFIVEQCYQQNGIQYVIIKQVQNNFATLLDDNTRENYWIQRVQKELKPKLQIVNDFFQIRINYLIKNIKNIPEDQGDLKIILKVNLDYYFETLVSFLEQLYSNYVPYQDYLSKLLEVLLNEIQFVFILSEDFLVKLERFIQSISELIIEQFINIIQQLFDLEDFKSNLLKKWNQQFENQNFIIQDYNFKKLRINSPTFSSASLNWRQIQMQEVISLQIVKHQFSGRVAYEATLSDGNKILLHDINSKPGDLTFVKKFEFGQTQTGYSEYWKSQGEPINTNNLNIKDIQTSVKGKSGNSKFNLKNFDQNKTILNQKQIGQLGQAGGAFGAVIGATIVDAFYGEVSGKSLAQNTLLGGTLLALSYKTPLIGLAIQGGLGLFQLGQIITNEQLTKKEMAKEIGKLVCKTATNIATTTQAISYGMMIGTSLGPAGTIFGGIIGGIFGGIAGQLTSKQIENIAKFDFEVSLNRSNKAQEKNGLLITPGVNPQIKFYNVQKKVNSLILLAYTNLQRIAWVVVNISPSIQYIEQNDKLGRISIKYFYVGPFDYESSIIFYLFGVQEKQVNEKKVIDAIQNNGLNIVCFAKKEIKL